MHRYFTIAQRLDASTHAGSGVDDPAHGPACRPFPLPSFPSEPLRDRCTGICIRRIRHRFRRPAPAKARIGPSHGRIAGKLAGKDFGIAAPEIQRVDAGWQGRILKRRERYHLPPSGGECPFVFLVIEAERPVLGDAHTPRQDTARRKDGPDFRTAGFSEAQEPVHIDGGFRNIRKGVEPRLRGSGFLGGEQAQLAFGNPPPLVPGQGPEQRGEAFVFECAAEDVGVAWASHVVGNDSGKQDAHPGSVKPEPRYECGGGARHAPGVEHEHDGDAEGAGAVGGASRRIAGIGGCRTAP